MSKTKKVKSKKVSPKKQLNEQIAGQITTALNGSLKDMLGEKKLQSRIKKAARLLTEGIKLKTNKEPKADKKKEKKKKKKEDIILTNN